MKTRWTKREKLFLLLALASLASPISLVVIIKATPPGTLLAWALGIEVCNLLLLVYLVVTSDTARG